MRWLRNSRVFGPICGDVVRWRAWRGAARTAYQRCREDAQRLHFLRNAAGATHQGKILVVSINDDSLGRLQQEAMLATGLRLEGFRPVVVLRCRACTLAYRVFEAFGITDFAYLDDISLSAAEISDCRSVASQLQHRAGTLAAVKEWRYRDSWIGPQVLATLSRLRFQGLPDLSDPTVKADLRRILPKILQQVWLSEKLLDATQPTLAIVNEANYASYGPVVDACAARGIDVIQFVQPWKDDALTFKRLTKSTRRHHPSSVSIETLNRFEAVPWTSEMEAELTRLFSGRYSGEWLLQARNQANTRAFAKAELIREFGLDPTKKIAVVFSHVLWDANLFYGEDLFDDMGEWFIETVKAGCRNPRVNWLIKLHPANLWKRPLRDGVETYSEYELIRKHVGELPPHVVLLGPDTPVSTWSLFQTADYGLTVRGTSGMELPVFGTPVFTAGTGRYSGLGITIDSASREEYLDRLSRIENTPRLSAAQVLRAKRHAYAAFVLRLWQMRSFTCEIRRDLTELHPLRQTMRCNIASMDELARNGDLAEFARWAARERGEVDFLARDDVKAAQRSSPSRAAT